MSPRERILTIRLSDKAAKHPMYAKTLGIESAYRWFEPKDLPSSETAESSRSE